jgi:MYXO-CTERM domain-containing protein
LPAASAYIEFLAEEVLVVAGPGSVLFPEQVCALEPQVAVTFSASVAISEYAAPQAYKLTTLLHPAAGSPLRYSQSVSTDVLLEVALASSAPVMVAAEAKESPPAPVIALLAVLALAAVVVRRRNA